MEKKITKKEMFAQIIANYSLTAEEKAFLEHEIELLKRKSSKDRKPTTKQLENETIKQEILSAMNVNQLYTCTEITKLIATEISINKASALLTQMVGNGSVIKTTEKRKSYFQKVVEG